MGSSVFVRPPCLRHAIWSHLLGSSAYVAEHVLKAMQLVRLLTPSLTWALCYVVHKDGPAPACTRQCACTRGETAAKVDVHSCVKALSRRARAERMVAY